MGPSRMGRHRGDLPLVYSLRRHVPLGCIELAVELCHWLRHALSRQPYDVRSERREGGELGRQGLLHLGRNLRGQLLVHVLLHP